jgi:hypothetical protein
MTNICRGCIEHGAIFEREKQLAAAYAKINEMKCCGNCTHYTQMIDQIECEFYCAIEDRLDVTGVVNGNNKCDKWEMRKGGIYVVLDKNRT